VKTRALLVALVALTPLLAAPSQDAKDARDKETLKEKEAAKEKEKAAKAKPPARSYSDEDLKKYKDKRKEDGAGAQAGSGGESSTDEEASAARRHAREHGGYQERRPDSRAQEPGREGVASPPADEPTSPEEANWKSRARQARAPLEAALGHVKELEAQIADQRDKLNPMSASYVLGGNSTAGPGAVYEIEEKLRNLEGALGGARTVVAEAEKSWQAFLEEARAAGASPAWLNP
jgi:hypothetical protein